MTFEKHYDVPETITEPACVLLRSKRIYVTGQPDPDHPDEAGGSYCWCNRTQHVLGPDDQSVAREHCIPGRDCYRDCC